MSDVVEAEARVVPSGVPEGWREVALGEVVSVGRGSSPRPIKDYVINKPGIPWVKIADATATTGRNLTKTREFIKEEGRSTTVYPGDLIVSNSATPGIPIFLQIEACVHDGWLTFKDYKNIDKLFLYYFFLNYRRVLEHSASGSVFKNLKIDIVKSLELTLPLIEEQKAIAGVLSAFDDKIELLREQNQTLEQTAQTIFNEWFGKYSPDEPQNLPKGWRVGGFKEIMTLTMGQSPSSKSYNYDLDGLPLLNGAIELKSDGIFPLKYTIDSKRESKKGDILLCIRATIGNINISNRVYSLGRGVAAISPDKGFYYFTFYFLQGFIDKISKNATGSVIKGLSKDDFNNAEIIIPESSLLRKFDDVIQPIFKKIRDNSEQIQTLTKTRDTLLPKLMTGEVRVGTKVAR